MINNNEKITELQKYRDLVIATIDYYLENGIAKIKTENFDSDEHYKKLKTKKRETVSKGYYTTTTTIYIYIIIIILSLSLSGFQGFLQLSKTCNDLYYTLLKMA